MSIDLTTLVFALLIVVPAAAAGLLLCKRPLSETSGMRVPKWHKWVCYHCNSRSAFRSCCMHVAQCMAQSNAAWVCFSVAALSMTAAQQRCNASHMPGCVLAKSELVSKCSTNLQTQDN